MEYKDFFSPKTLEKLNKQSADNLKQMLGDKDLIQTLTSSQRLLSQITQVEAPYKSQLEQLAIKMVKELYPIIDEEEIKIDAKIGDIESVTGELDESISPESRRRITNAITQGAAFRGAFAFYLFKEHLDEINSDLVDKYNEIMKATLGIYDDDNAIAMFLSLLAQGHKAAGGSSKVIIKEEEGSDITIQARAINFPMLVHEIIKGLYELISLQGFKGDKAQRQATADKVDQLKHEPEDIKYGKFIFDALNSLFANSEYDNPRIREFFFIEVYKLDDNEFISLIENAINGELTRDQQQWVDGTLKIIDKDLKSDAYNDTGLDEIKVNRPGFDLENIKSVEARYKGNIKDEFLTPGDLYLFWDLGTYFGMISSLTTQVILVPKNGFEISNWQVTQSPEELKQIKNLLNKGQYVHYKKWNPNGLDEIKILNPNQYRFPAHKTSTGEILVTAPHSKTVYTGRMSPEGKAWEFYGVPPYMLFTAQSKKVPHETFERHPFKILSIPEEYFDFSVTWNKVGDTPIKEIKVDSSTTMENKLFEYSEKTIATTIERWKKESNKVDDNIARQIINRFDQIKSGLAQKLDIVNLPDDLKKGNNYLNIDKYSFKDMVNLIRSVPENPEKVKKEAVKKFVQKDEIDKPTARSYVARFMANKEALRLGTKEGTDTGFSAEEVQEYIPPFLQRGDAYLDPRNWPWQAFEQMLDAVFPSQKEAEDDENFASTDADKVYDKNGIEIYRGDDINKCISYNPIEPSTKRRKYGWCVTQAGNTNYDYYRFQEKAPTFYFVFDRNKSSAPEHSPFEDKWHAFVVQVTADGKEYIITAADNRGDHDVEGWENVKKVVSPETWDRIKDLKDYFKPIPLSSVERGRKFASGKSLSLEEFKELTQDEKILYTQGKASKNQISNDILEILPKYKINVGGRTTTLANVAIDNGQKFPYSILKDNEPLAKRYAIFRFRHTNYSSDPIPLPYVKYLDDAAKKKYISTFQDNLTFEYIYKYFGEEATKEYVNNQVKNFEYLPPVAAKYIEDPKQKKLFEIYVKLFDTWEFGADTNVDDEKLAGYSSMPEQSVTPKPLTSEQWRNFSQGEQKMLINLAKQVNTKDKYSTLLYALPYIIEDNDTLYLIFPKDSDDYNFENWELTNEQGKPLKNINADDSTIAGQELRLGYPDISEDPRRVYSSKEVKFEGEPFALKESIYEDVTKYKLQRMAGILK